MKQFTSIRRYHAKSKLNMNVNTEERIHFDNDTGCYQAGNTSYIHFNSPGTIVPSGDVWCLNGY